ncbi:MAG: formimidoylglutamate deiminase [Gemmatimonadota bacterium]
MSDTQPGAAAEIIEADLTWTGQRFDVGVQVAVGGGARIEAVGRLGLNPTQRLRGQALLPGLVDVHSHAFQIGLRGRGERFPGGRGSFWSWREAMYELVDSLDLERFRALTLEAFLECRDAGITTVGEFHYVHHATAERDHDLDIVLLDAAAEAGIRLVLLSTHYQNGGFGKPLHGSQRRFDTRSPGEFWTSVDRLSAGLEPGTQTLGVAAHSVRAVPIEAIAELHQEARHRDLVFHMHVEEQPQEIEDCVDIHGCRPMTLLNDTLEIDDRFTAVHCTHTASDDMHRFLERGGNVCICPLTEANLGDGIADVPAIHGAKGNICLGTDSNARIAMTEEMRWLEYVQRLKSQQRGLVTDQDGGGATALLDVATVNGAGALGVATGLIAPGLWADFVTLDLTAPALIGVDADTLLDAWVFGTGNEAIVATCVGGAWRPSRPARVANAQPEDSD